MNGTSDRKAEPYEEGRGSPRRRRELLERTQRQAQRALDFRAPWLSLVAAGVVLVGFGAVWLSVRGSASLHRVRPRRRWWSSTRWCHPDRLGAVRASSRAEAGVSGRSVTSSGARRQRAVAVAFVAVYVLMAALAHRSGQITRTSTGLYGVTATLIVLAAFWAGAIDGARGLAGI